MRVICDIRPLLDAQRSGVGTYAAEMVRALARRDANEYALFANASRGAMPGDLPSPGPRLTHRFTRHPNRLLNASFALLGAPPIERLAGGGDLLYLPNLNFAATRLPLVVTVHDLSFVRFPRFFSLKQRLWHGAIDAGKLLRRATRVVAVSRHTRTDVIETFCIPEDKVAVASPAVSSDFSPRSKEETDALAAKFGLRAPYYLFLGALEPRKNVAGLIEAYDRVDADLDLVIAGGKGWLYDEIFRRAERSKKRDRIKFLGYVRDEDKPALYSGAAALVYPSFYEGFGMPPLEAMACGTPVVASHASSLGEVVGDAGLLVDPYSPDDIASAMKAVVEDAALAAALRGRGIARAKAFTWDASAATLERVFAEARG